MKVWFVSALSCLYESRTPDSRLGQEPTTCRGRLIRTKQTTLHYWWQTQTRRNCCFLQNCSAFWAKVFAPEQSTKWTDLLLIKTKQTTVLMANTNEWETKITHTQKIHNNLQNCRAFWADAFVPEHSTNWTDLLLRLHLNTPTHSEYTYTQSTPTHTHTEYTYTQSTPTHTEYTYPHRVLPTAVFINEV